MSKPHQVQILTSVPGKTWADCQTCGRKSKQGDQGSGRGLDGQARGRDHRPAGCPMTKYEAHMRVNTLWSRWRTGVGRRVAMTRLRSRSVTDRCEIGYLELVNDYPERWAPTVVGCGATWEQALERAAAREKQDAEAGGATP